MTPEERQAQIKTILDQHDQVFRAMRRASESFREAIKAMDHALDDQRDAIDAAIAANQAALKLFNEDRG